MCLSKMPWSKTGYNCLSARPPVSLCVNLSMNVTVALVLWRIMKMTRTCSSTTTLEQHKSPSWKIGGCIFCVIFRSFFFFIIFHSFFLFFFNSPGFVYIDLFIFSSIICFHWNLSQFMTISFFIYRTFSYFLHFVVSLAFIFPFFLLIQSSSF